MDIEFQTCMNPTCHAEYVDQSFPSEPAWLFCWSCSTDGWTIDEDGEPVAPGSAAEEAA